MVAEKPEETVRILCVCVACVWLYACLCMNIAFCGSNSATRKRREFVHKRVCYVVILWWRCGWR